MEKNYVDEEKKEVDIKEFMKECPEIAEFIMLKGLSNKMDDFLFFIRRNKIVRTEGIDDNINEDGMKDENFEKELLQVERVKQCISAINEFEKKFYSGTRLYPIIDTIKCFIDQPDMLKKIKDMDYKKFIELTSEMNGTFLKIEDIKWSELSEEDKNNYQEIISMITPSCSGVEYVIANPRQVDFVYDRNGISINTTNIELNNKTKNEIFENLNIDQILSEKYMITNPFSKMLAKRKIDPAILAAIDIHKDMTNPYIELFKKMTSATITMPEDYVADTNKQEVVETYLETIFGKSLQSENGLKLNIKYDLNGMEDKNVKRYAKYVKKSPNVEIEGLDERSFLDKMKERLFAKKLPRLDETEFEEIKPEYNNEFEKIKFNVDDIKSFDENGKNEDNKNSKFGNELDNNSDNMR